MLIKHETLAKLTKINVITVAVQAQHNLIAIKTAAVNVQTVVTPIEQHAIDQFERVD